MYSNTIEQGDWFSETKLKEIKTIAQEVCEISKETERSKLDGLHESLVNSIVLYFNNRDSENLNFSLNLYKLAIQHPGMGNKHLLLQNLISELKDRTTSIDQINAFTKKWRYEIQYPLYREMNAVTVHSVISFPLNLYFYFSDEINYKQYLAKHKDVWIRFMISHPDEDVRLQAVESMKRQIISLFKEGWLDGIEEWSRLVSEDSTSSRYRREKNESKKIFLHVWFSLLTWILLVFQKETNDDAKNKLTKLIGILLKQLFPTN